MKEAGNGVSHEPYGEECHHGFAPIRRSFWVARLEVNKHGKKTDYALAESDI